MPLTPDLHREDLDFNFYYDNDYDGDYYEYEPDDVLKVPDYDDEEGSDQISLSELVDQCVIPTLSQTYDHVRLIIVLCLVSRILTSLFKKICVNQRFDQRLHVCFSNIISSIFGLVVLYFFFQENLVFIIVLIGVVYPLISLTTRKCRERTGTIVTLVIVVYLLTCELFIVKRSEWHKIRGSQMILSMKLISLSFDLDSQSPKQPPPILHYLGYTLQVGTVIFGPWISYADYLASVTETNVKILDFYWVFKCLSSLITSCSCLVVSTCLSHWILGDVSFVWLAAYRDALSFRFSHYFICKLSELTLVLSGFGSSRNQNGEVKWDMTTTKILNVEFPRSLVEVVTSWNLPMHAWLKNYVFKVSKPLGNFSAIFLTYCASSMLHGLNFQLSAVLLSLGFYTYIEFNLRRKLSECFEACIGSRPCKQNCKHLHKWIHPYVLLVNLSFTLLSVFHLAYLGLMFDSSPSEEEGYNMDHTLLKWSQLGFSSHLVAMTTFVVNLLI